MNDDVTLVIPTLGRESLARALHSAYKQTRKFDEIIIESSIGSAASTRNKACAKVTTEWTAFLDDDDFLYPEHLATLLQHSEGYDLVYSWWDGYLSNLTIEYYGFRRTPKGLEFDDYLREQLYKSNFIPVTFLVRTSIGNQVGWFPEQSPDIPYEDWGFLLKLLDINARIKHVNTVTWQYNK